MYPAMYRAAIKVNHILSKVTVKAVNPEVNKMKKRYLILIGAICYCIAPDLIAGPVDDSLLVMASMVYSMITADNKDRDPEYIKMKRDG